MKRPAGGAVQDGLEPTDDVDGAFFDAYYGTHLVHRKGELDAAYLKARASYFDRTWSSLLPQDRDARILDAGCGVGALVGWLQRRGYAHAEGIDISAELIERGGALGVRNLTCADVNAHLEARQARYNTIVFRDILEHFPAPRIVHMMRLARRALDRGGRVIVQVPNAEAPAWGRIRYGDFTHEMAFTADSLTQLAGVTGFRIIRFVAAGPILTIGRGLPRFLLWKTIEFSYRMLLYGVAGRRRSIVTESIIAVAQVDESRGDSPHGGLA